MTVTPDGAEPVEHSGDQTWREKFLRHAFKVWKCLTVGDCAHLEKNTQKSEIPRYQIVGIALEGVEYGRQAKPRR